MLAMIEPADSFSSVSQTVDVPKATIDIARVAASVAPIFKFRTCVLSFIS